MEDWISCDYKSVDFVRADLECKSSHLNIFSIFNVLVLPENRQVGL
jgi:hypothetical protein